MGFEFQASHYWKNKEELTSAAGIIGSVLGPRVEIKGV
jgi:hypothetical protein